MWYLFSSHFLTSLPHIFNHDNRYCFNPILFSPFFFVTERKFCRLLFWMGPQNPKRASMGLFLKGLQESRPPGVLLWQLSSGEAQNCVRKSFCLASFMAKVLVKLGSPTKTVLVRHGPQQHKAWQSEKFTMVIFQFCAEFIFDKWFYASKSNVTEPYFCTA